MGKVTKALGFDQKGSITISLERKTVLGGDTLVGSIAVTISEAVKVNALLLNVVGKEVVAYTCPDPRNDDQPRRHHSKRHCLKDKTVVTKIATTLAPGSYSYPFEYHLAEDLPGSFAVSGINHGVNYQNVCASIEYKAKAVLDVDGILGRDLRGSCKFTVHQRFSGPVKPNLDSIRKTVRYLCCINKGVIDIAVAMDKNKSSSSSAALRR
ncbi:hypothetical protein P43SY_010635 [Pythium insidiosum]|uniref:Arrestin-like N-terminal domain-containing protein n=1 Tax=Pythium insidiosum TaxID=114742 RepID=A0AAD5M0C1_PYTIN|nr:hypothetical protein P43SY_010635 [Pythium insidiosum]